MESFSCPKHTLFAQKLKVHAKPRQIDDSTTILTTMATSNRGNNGNNRLMYLLDRLDSIRCASHATEAEEAMEDFAHVLLQLRILKGGLQQLHYHLHDNEEAVFHKCDETLLQDLDTFGAAIHILLDAIYRFTGHASPEFHSNACIALVHFAVQSRERSQAIYRMGGLDCIIRLMECHRSVDYVQNICIAALLVIGKNTGFCLLDLEAVILQQIVSAMEYHQVSCEVYVVACSALGTLFGPESGVVVNSNPDNENDLYIRSLTAISYGIILHFDDRVAQGVGRTLLCNMVGPDIADEMIAEVENDHHGGGVLCAAAA